MHIAKKNKRNRWRKERLLKCGEEEERINGEEE